MESTSDNVPHESLNHYSKGAVISFLHRQAAGLAPTSPGYGTFDIRPRPGGGLSRVAQRLDTRHGPIEIEWRQTTAAFELDVTVPAGTEASIELPNGESTVAGPGRHTLASGR